LPLLRVEPRCPIDRDPGHDGRSLPGTAGDRDRSSRAREAGDAFAGVPGEEGHFLINAYGMTYDEITASSLVKIDFEGNIVLDSGTGYGINHAGFVIHSAVHRGRSDVACVLHTHTPAGMAVSAMKCGLLPLAQTSMRFAKVGYHDYEGVATKLAEQERLVRDLGSHAGLILRNHGLLVVGASIPEAFYNIFKL
jgi:ribulose-5-phosphate 4-epimerase/fuculose-1-phosphate aldolase